MEVNSYGWIRDMDAVSAYPKALSNAQYGKQDHGFEEWWHKPVASLPLDELLREGYKPLVRQAYQAGYDKCLAEIRSLDEHAG